MVNYNNGYRPPPPPLSYNPMPLSRRRPRPLSYPYPNSMPMMQRPPPYYNQRRSYRPSASISRRHRSRRCRPVVHIIEADSCSSISTCSSISSCSSGRHRSCYCSKICQTPQQPIILLPIQCQPQPTVLTGPIQQQPIVLPSVSNISSTPMRIQPLNLAPQMVSNRKPLQIQAGPIQYVQAAPRSTSTSELKFTPAKTYSSVAPQRVLVNSTNKKQITAVKTIPPSVTTHKII